MKKNLKNCLALATICCVKGALTGLKIISAFYWDLCQMLLKEVKFGYLSKEIVLEHCRWYPFCWMKRKINRDRRRQITGQTWPWVRATPSSPVSPYSKVSTKSLPRTARSFVFRFTCTLKMYWGFGNFWWIPFPGFHLWVDP